MSALARAKCGRRGSLPPPGAFFIQDLPPFFGLTPAETVKLTLGTPPLAASTDFDGVSDASGLSSGQVGSIRTLYFGPRLFRFSAAKVRKN